MSHHSSTVFTNSCIKTPLNPINRLPSPSYERKRYSSVHNLDSNDIMSFADFYRNIPDYTELHHLSNTEFYHKLNELRYKKREYELTTSTPTVIYDHNDEEVPTVKTQKSKTKKTVKNCKKMLSNYEMYNKDKSFSFDDNDSLYSNKNMCNKSRKKCVRLQNGRHSSNYSEQTHIECKSPQASDFLDNYDFKKCRSMPCSPVRKITSPKITVPKPFKMTQREEEEKTLNELYRSSECLVEEPKLKEKQDDKIIKAHPVPIESRVPLFDQIMSDQEKRRQINKINSAIELNSQMRPFHFNERSKPPSRCLSTPHLFSETGLDLKPRQFKAKPVPKNLYSNYFYQKMWEDDYYRAMKRRIRAEEMLRASSLPPSMAERQKNEKSSGKCTKASCHSDLDFREYSTPSTGSSNTTNKTKRRKRKNKKIPNYCMSHEKFKQNYLNKKNDFISTSPSPFSFETEKRSQRSKPASPYKTSAKQRIPKMPSPIYPVSRPNLAAALRVEWVKSKLHGTQKEDDAPGGGTSPENKMRGWSAHAVRTNPAWQAVNYPSHSADLAERLETRRAEQRLRQAEHDLNMELMIDRVLKTPLLLERNWKDDMGMKKHSCHMDSVGEFHRNKSKHSSRHIKSSKSSKHHQKSKLSDDRYDDDDFNHSLNDCEDIKLDRSYDNN